MVGEERREGGERDRERETETERETEREKEREKPILNILPRLNIPYNCIHTIL